MLSQELDALIDGLNERHQQQVRKLLVRLVDFVANTSLYTRRRMPLHELRPTGLEAPMTAPSAGSSTSQLLQLKGV
jgi:hypothetical protein